MITEDYVSFEIAKLLKEKGFDEECRARYDSNGSLHYEKYPIEASGAEMHNSILCPTIQMVMEWLREVHSIAIDTEWEHLWYAYIKPMTANPTEDDYYQCFSTKYEQAVEVAIKYCLEKKLIFLTMATIKSYTSLEQSKKLAEILPLESADMGWYYTSNLNAARNQMWVGTKAENADIPCWSLASLLNVIPKHIDEFNVLRIDISTNDFAIWYDEIGSGVNNDLPDITRESAVDACVVMIEKLHELNLL